MAELTLQIKVKFKDELTRPLTGVTGKLLAFGKGSVAAFKGVTSAVFNLKTALVGLGAAFGVLKAAQFAKQIADSADSLGKLALSTGDLVENLSELQQVFAIGNVDAGKFETILRATLKAQQAALEPGAEMARNFERLGIAVDELATLAPSRLYERMAEGLDQFSTAQEKAVALGRILPKNFLDALPVIGAGLQEFQSTVTEVRRLQGTVSGEQAKVADQFADAITKLGIAVDGVGRQLLVSFGPSATAALEKLATMIAENKDQILALAQAIGSALVKAFSLAVDAVIGFVSLIESIPGVDLIDKDAALRDIEELRIKLLALQEARKPTPREPFLTLDVGGGTSALAQRTLSIEPMRRNRARQMAGSFAGMSTEAMDALQAELTAKIAELTARVDQGLAGSLQETRQKLAAELAAVRDTLAASAQGQPKAGGEGPLPGLPSIEQVEQYGEQLNAALEPAGKGAATVFREASEQAQGLSAEIRKLASDEEQEAKNAVSLQRERLQLGTQLAALAESAKPFQRALLDLEEQQQVLALEDAARRGVINAQELAAALGLVSAEFDKLRVQQEGGFAVGLSRSLEGLKLQVEDFATTAGAALGDVVGSTVDGLSTAIADVITGTKSAKDAFKDFAISFLADIAKMIAKMIVLGTIKALFGLEEGGVVGGEVEQTLPMRGYAKGGIARSPTLAVFGEGRNAEAFVPLPDNRSIPVTFANGQGGSSPVINLSITAMDSKDVTRTLVEHQGLLRTIWQTHAETRAGMRQVIRRAAS